MERFSIEKLLENTNTSAYQLTILIAKRAQELAEGEQPLVEANEKEKPLTIALRELANGCLDEKIKKIS